MKPADPVAPVPVMKDSVPVVHYVNLWMKQAGCLTLGERHDSLVAARNKTNHGDKRICILKITTTVEVA